VAAAYAQRLGAADRNGRARGVGHLFLIFAFDKAPAAAIAPFAYSALIWASIAGYVFFGEIPDMWTILGASVITASGLYIFHRERIVQRRR
jgi:drug/metabolite transporter (DMT)-like permease